MHFVNVGIQNFGYELPPNVVSSEEIETRLAPVYERLKLPRGRLELMSGIQERRFWDTGTLPSYGAACAGRKAIDASGFAAEDIECLIFTAVCRDMMEPATASFVHKELHLSEKCLIFDLSNACLGFLNGMILLANMIENRQIKNGLIVSSETAENLVESTIADLLADPALTRKSIKSSFASLTIGSGAVGLVMTDSRIHDSGHRLKHVAYRANTSFNDLCRGGDKNSSETLMATDSEELLKRGVETAAATWNDFLADSGWHNNDIEQFFCHQVGRAHASLLFASLHLDPAKNFETLPLLGNVGSVSAPLTFAMGIEKGKLSPGQKAAILGIGSGINCLMLGIEW